jgi:hypothetical protein
MLLIILLIDFLWACMKRRDSLQNLCLKSIWSSWMVWFDILYDNIIPLFLFVVGAVIPFLYRKDARKYLTTAIYGNLSSVSSYIYSWLELFGSLLALDSTQFCIFSVTPLGNSRWVLFMYCIHPALNIKWLYFIFYTYYLCLDSNSPQYSRCWEERFTTRSVILLCTLINWFWEIWRRPSNLANRIRIYSHVVWNLCRSTNSSNHPRKKSSPFILFIAGIGISTGIDMEYGILLLKRRGQLTFIIGIIRSLLSITSLLCWFIIDVKGKIKWSIPF